MANFRTTQQRIADEIDRDIERWNRGQSTNVNKRYGNLMPVPTSSALNAIRNDNANKAGEGLGLSVETHVEKNPNDSATRANDTRAKQRTRVGSEYREDLFRENYNEMPNYNVIARALDPEKSEAYSQKSKLTNRYNTAVNNKLDKILDEYQANGGDKLPVLAGVNANEILHPFQYSQAKNEIEPLLAQNGISFDELENYYRTQALKDQNAQMAEYAKEHPVLGTGLSYVTNQIGGIESAVSGLDNYLSGTPLNSNQALQEYGKLTPTIRNTVREGIDNPVGQALYDVETSLGDMLYSLALGGGSQKASLGLMSTVAGANTLNEQMDKNTDPWQKVATAAASGAIEAITERLPMENLFRIVNNPAGKQTAKMIMMNILKQAGTEASEEAISEIANNFVDGIVNGSQSDYNQSVNAYMAQGMPREQAIRQAETDIAKNAAYSALIGGITGGVMAGGATAVNNAIVDNTINNAINNAQNQAEAEAASDSESIKYDGERSVLDRFNINGTKETNPDVIEGIRRINQNVNDYLKTGNEDSMHNAMILGEQVDRMGANDHYYDLLWMMRNKFNQVAQNAARQNQVLPSLDNVNNLLLNNEVGIDDYGYRGLEQNADIPWLNQEDTRFWNNGSANLDEELSRLGYPEAPIDNDLDMSETDARMRAALDEYFNGRRMDNPTEFLDEGLPDLRMTQRFNWDNGENRGYRDVRSFENQPNVNWYAGDENVQNTQIPQLDAQTLSPELQTAQNQVARFMDQYRTTGNELYRNIADSIQQRINNELARNPQKTADESLQNVQTEALPQLSEQNSANEEEWARLISMAEQEQNTKKNGNNPWQRSQVMAEDIGLNPRTKITESDNKVTLTQEVIPPNTSQFASNSLANNIAQTEEGKAEVQRRIEEGEYNKGVNATNKVNVLSNDVSETEARHMINADRAGTLAKVLSGNLETNPILFEAGLQLLSDEENIAAQTGDWTQYNALASKMTGKYTDIGRILQLLSKRARHDMSRAIQTTNAIVQDINEKYFNTRKGYAQRARCSKLATALKNVGNDYTQLRGPVQQTKEQIRNGVIAELEKESSSISEGFNDQDIEYLTNMINNGANAKDIQLKLEQKFTTGQWDISNEDLDRVNRLFKFIEEEDPESRTAMKYEDAANAILAKYLPAKTFSEKVGAWRYLCMLLNPTTHSRNVGSTLMFSQALEPFSDKVGAVVQDLMYAMNPDYYKTGEKTKKFLPASRKMKAACDDYLMNHKWRSLTEGDTKYYDLGKGVKKQQDTFKGKGVLPRLGNALIQTNSNLLSFEDNSLMRLRFNQVMAGYLEKNGKKTDIFKSQDPKDIALVERAADYAVRRAKESAFHEDANWATLWKKHAREFENDNEGLSKATASAMEGTLPFAKTPYNIGRMGVRYSPIGLIKSFTDITDPRANGNPMKAIESFSRGLTGSGVMALGFMLAGMGYLRAKGKKDEGQLDKETGKQDYSIVVKGNNGKKYYYSLDWASPFAMPLFVGAQLHDSIMEGGSGSYVNDVANAFSAIADPMTEMSMFSGFNNALDALSGYQTGASTLGQTAMNIGYGYLSQMVPSIAGKIARTVDNKQRNTYYTGDNDGVGGTLEKFGKKTLNRLPVLSESLEPFVGALGEERQNNGDSLASKLFFNFLSPGYYSEGRDTELTDELYRLHGETDKVKNSLPELAESTPYTDQAKMSERDYTEWSRTYGKNYANMETEAIQNSRYKAMDAESQAEIISEIKSLSKAISKEEFTTKAQDNAYSYEISNNYKTEMKAYDYKGIDGVIDYLTINKAAKDLATKNGRNQASKADVLNAIESTEGLSKADKAAYLKMMKNYTQKGQFVDKYMGSDYAYDWFKIEQAADSDSKQNLTVAVLMSGLPEEEQQVFLDMINLKDSEIKSLIQIK